jgi:starch phosphorylase
MDAPNLFTEDNKLNMTLLALEHADYVNGVAKKHGEVSRQLFPGYQIDSITNGIHAGTWMSPELQQVFDQHFPGWRADASMLRYALGLPARIVQDAHTAAKARLLTHVAHTTGVALKQDVFTIGFARRATAYKRADLLLRDPERLRIIAERAGGLQIIYAGKAHTRDTEGKHIIERIHQIAASLKPTVTVVFVPGYAMELASLMVAGVDLWLNTPLPPYEASGTSGMKAAVNGVPSLSVLDGWWIEGCLQGVTGWSFGTMPDDNLGRPEERDAADTAALYEMLEHTIVPTWRGTPDAWANVMRSSIALNGSFFNTHRMIQEYVMRAYFQ